MIQEVMTVGKNCGRESTSLASTIGATIDKPRTARLQCHRANAGDPEQSCVDYFLINVYYPFIDHVVKELETRFTSDHEGLMLFSTWYHSIYHNSARQN